MVSIPGVVRSVIDPFATGPIVEELDRRRAALLSELDGTILELAAPPADVEVPSEATFDHVVSTGWLGAADDVDAAVRQLVRWIGLDGWLHVVEPSIGVGATARVQRMAATVGRRRTGWRTDHDIPAALRRAGLAVTDLERFSMPVPSAVLRPWVAGRARCRRPIPAEREAAAEDQR